MLLVCFDGDWVVDPSGFRNVEYRVLDGTSWGSVESVASLQAVASSHVDVAILWTNSL